MNRAETAQLLTMCAALDLRTIGESDVIAWHAILDDVPLPDAQSAVVEFYKNEPARRINPADIRKLAKARRQARIEHADTTAVPAADPDDVPGYLRALRQGRNRDADPLEPRPVRELLAGAFRRPPDALTPDELARRARELRDQLPRRNPA